jgi:hypothetical protein
MNYIGNTTAYFITQTTNLQSGLSIKIASKGVSIERI